MTVSCLQCWVLKLNLKLFSGNTFVCMILFFIRLYFLLIRCTLHWTAQTSLHLGYRCKTTLGECPCTVKGLLLVMQLHSSEYHLCFKGLFKIKPTPMPVGSVKQGHEGRIPVQSINCNKIQTIRNVSVYHFSFFYTEQASMCKGYHTWGSPPRDTTKWQQWKQVKKRTVGSWSESL